MGTKGYILMAYGHSNYGKLAVNLAVGLKLNTLHKIQLITTQHVFDMMPVSDIDLFDIISIVDSEELFYVDGVKEVGYAKCRMNLYAAFEECVFIDVDSLANPSVNPDFLFDFFELVDFSIQNFGIIESNVTTGKKMSQWASNDKVIRMGLGSYYPCDVHSCFMYFKKSKTENIFNEARNSYNDVKKIGYHNVWFNSIPDELLFSVGISRSGYIMSNEMLEPECFIGVNSRTIINKFKLLESTPLLTFSTGQNVLNSRVATFYNDLAFMAFKESGRRFTNRWIDKRNFVPLRQK